MVDRTFTIVYDLIAMRHRLRVTDEVEGNKSNGFKFSDKCFYSFEQAKSWGVRLTIKILKHSKVRLTRSLVQHPNGRIFLAFGAPSQNFLQESRKAAAW